MSADNDPSNSFDVTATFTVAATSPGNRLPEPPTTQIEPANPTEADPLVCFVTMPEIRDPDYDIVRYHYKWEDISGSNPTCLRECIHAAQTDVLACNKVAIGAIIRCTVKTYDATGSIITDCMRTCSNGVPERDAGGTSVSVVQVSEMPDSDCTTHPALTICDGVDGADDVWRDIAAGSVGLVTPRLRAEGGLDAGQEVEFSVFNGAPQSPLVVLFSTMRADLVLGRGTLMPFPAMGFFASKLDDDGRATASLTVPHGLASGTAIYGQAWVLDGTSRFGLMSTNAVVRVSP
ncbi:MAG: hypothetical protein AAF628_29830 [Planctomycetota bacterium]